MVTLEGGMMVVMTTETDGRTDGRMDGRTDGRSVGQTDERSVEWTDGRTDGRAEGRTDGCTAPHCDARNAPARTAGVDVSDMERGRTTHAWLVVDPSTGEDVLGRQDQATTFTVHV